MRVPLFICFYLFFPFVFCFLTVTTIIIVAITINPMPVDNIMMILVTFPSGGLYLSGFSDAEFASETAGGENTTDKNTVNAMVRRRIIVFSCV